MLLGLLLFQGDFESSVLRVAVSSLATPMTVMDVNMDSMNRRVKKVTQVLGGFDESQYTTERVWATSKDSTKARGCVACGPTGPGRRPISTRIWLQVPISLVYRKDLAKLDGSDPLLLNGYGSYESCNDPYFSSVRLSLIDRGFVFAIAHVRGGGEMGRFW